MNTGKDNYNELFSEGLNTNHDELDLRLSDSDDDGEGAEKRKRRRHSSANSPRSRHAITRLGLSVVSPQFSD